jgi:hypothetical protein
MYQWWLRMPPTLHMQVGIPNQPLTHHQKEEKSK